MQERRNGIRSMSAWQAAFSGRPGDLARSVILLLLLTLTAGCAMAPLPGIQAPCREPRTVYAINHGRHVGLVIAAADLAAALPSLADTLRQEDHVEIGWGDLRYYQAEEKTLGMSLSALFLPTAGVLHVATFRGPPALYFAGLEVIDLMVEQAGYENLLNYVVKSFACIAEGEPIRIGPGLYGRSWFYRAEGTFHACNTCNTWMARGLAETGYPVSRRTVTASGLLKQLRDMPPDICFQMTEDG
jgi:uncharacterized protein (TIGR02117 family)